MTTSISRLYDTRAEAERVTVELTRSGIPENDISIVSNGDHDPDAMSDTAKGASAGAGVGAVVGGGAGLLTGLGMMAIPGVGPIVAAGWIAATLTGMLAGAATGAAAGGIVGALTESGVDEQDAHVYAEAIRRGGSMVLVKTDEAHRDLTETVLANHNSVMLTDRRSLYESEGWRAFNDKSGPSTADDRDALHPPRNNVM